jgi:hypothetical protein
MRADEIFRGPTFKVKRHPICLAALEWRFRASADPAALECAPPLRSLRRRRTRRPKGGALKRIVFTIRRTAHVVVASVAVELALDFGAGALAVILAPFLGEWVYVAAGVIVIGSLPVLGLNIAHIARREWKRHRLHT